MFLPIEGLYAEVVRNVELLDTLQNQYKVVVCGPTTLTALLNSLQLGFKTLYIQKRSSEIWQFLSTLKQEFEKYVALLEKSQGKLADASTNLEQATKSSQKIAKKLDDVGDLVGLDYETSDIQQKIDISSSEIDENSKKQNSALENLNKALNGKVIDKTDSDKDDNSGDDLPVAG